MCLQSSSRLGLGGAGGVWTCTVRLIDRLRRWMAIVSLVGVASAGAKVTIGGRDTVG